MRNPDINATSASVFKQGVSWYEMSARMEKMDIDAVAKTIPAGARRDTFVERATTMKAIASSSLDYQNSSYEQAHADRVGEQRVELRAAGLINKLPKELSGLSYTDDKGKGGGGLLNKHADSSGASSTPTVKQPPGVSEIDQIHSTVLAAAKTVAVHAEDKAYNQGTLNAMADSHIKLTNILAQHPLGSPQHEAASELMQKIDKIAAAKVTGVKPDKGLVPTKEEMWEAAGGKPQPITIKPPPVKDAGDKSTAFETLLNRFKAEGLDYDAATKWQTGWAGSTGALSAHAFKQYIAEQRGGLSEYKWPTGGSTGVELKKWTTEMGGKAKLDKAMALRSAYMQEILEHTNLQNSSQKDRAMFIVRSESSSALPSGFKSKPVGTQITILRPSASPGSHLKKTMFGATTGQIVPFVDIHSSILVPDVVGGGMGFYGKGENEWVFTHSGRPIIRWGDDHVVPNMGKDPTKWKAPYNHLRSLSSKK